MIADLETLLARRWFSDLDVALARAVTRLAGDTDPLVTLGAAEASRATAAGCVCVDINAIGKAAVPVDGEGEALRWPAAQAWLAALRSAAAAGDGSAPTPLVLDRAGRLYLHRCWRDERELARGILARAAVDDPRTAPVTGADLERLFPAPADKALDPHGAGIAGQRAAALAAADGLFTAISGGPGTGKTWTVAGCLALLAERALAAKEAPLRVVLLAPTGRAASRLADSLRAAIAGGGIDTSAEVLAALPREASTIHRALGYSPRTGGFRRHAASPLAADVVVVDETSMVDLALLRALMDAVPAGARVILLGDRDQLASVEAGAVFGEICAGPASAEASPSPLVSRVVHLDHSFRFGAGIGDLARAINAGDADWALALLDDPACPEVALIETGDFAEQEARVLELARRGFAPLIEQTEPLERLAALERFRVLTAHRRGAGGGELLGARLDRELAPAGAAGGFYPGRPVMVTRNDYHARLFNGDTGVVVSDEEGLKVCFPGPAAPRLVPISRLPVHETAYAVTVHKAQGAEFDEVLVVLPLSVSPVLTRELLYTAVTRARSQVTICASQDSVRRAVATPIRRSSGLLDALWGTSRNVTLP